MWSSDGLNPQMIQTSLATASIANWRAKRIYTVGATGAYTYTYRDSSPDLKVGVQATYRITAYKGEAESSYIEASTTPLPPWEVRLLEPADESTGVSLTPHLPVGA